MKLASAGSHLYFSSDYSEAVAYESTPKVILLPLIWSRCWSTAAKIFKGSTWSCLVCFDEDQGQRERTAHKMEKWEFEVWYIYKRSSVLSKIPLGNWVRMGGDSTNQKISLGYLVKQGFTQIVSTQQINWEKGKKWNQAAVSPSTSSNIRSYKV